MPNNKVITEREKAAIRYGIAYGVDSKVDLYRLAYNGTEAQIAAIADISAQASRWWNSRKISEFYARESEEYKIRQDHLRGRLRAEIVAEMEEARRTGRTTGDGLIDYSREENQIRKLNEIINHSGATGEELDALKMMIAEISRKRPQEGNEQKARYYLPLSCRECRVYILAKELLNSPEIWNSPVFVRWREGQGITSEAARNYKTPQYARQYLGEKTIGNDEL